MNQAAEKQTESTSLKGAMVVAYSGKYPTSGICIWDDGENALCIHVDSNDGECRFLFLVEPALRDKVAVFRDEEDYKLPEHIAGLCYCGEHPDCPGYEKEWTHNKMSPEEADSICYIAMGDSRELWAEVPYHHKYPSFYSGKLKENPELAPNYIAACRRAGDEKTHEARETAEMNTYLGKSYLVLDDRLNILDAYVLRYKDRKFLVSEGKAGGGAEHKWLDTWDVTMKFENWNTHQQRLKEMKELLPDNWPTPMCADDGLPF
ncbi:MAG: hypothetical protein KDI33_09185 [Halioglobus sp.]|nr:hypothetical protein [Halioglobus sp.]